MDYTSKLAQLYKAMISYDAGDVGRIQHFVKVHSFARLIGLVEGLSEEQLVILEAAAYVHDIGIKIAEKEKGSCSGELQELYGPPEAEKMLKECGFSKEQIERVSYLVGHHHTYTNIDGADYQILVEADFLVNLYEDNSVKETVQHTYQTIFKTNTGKWICREMFGI